MDLLIVIFIAVIVDAIYGEMITGSGGSSSIRLLLLVDLLISLMLSLTGMSSPSHLVHLMVLL